jgi:hypothetical protein
MSRRIVVYAALILLAGASLGAAAPGPPGASRPARPGAAPAKFRTVTLHIFSRVFGNFHDKVEAVPNREFRVGDTEYTARIIRFEPDFSLDLKTRKASSMSGEPNNPAFQIVVKRKGAPHDTSWAFFNMPPHFSARSQLAFVATRIEFTNRPPLESQDSLALRIKEREGGPR